MNRRVTGRLSRPEGRHSAVSPDYDQDMQMV